jgi:hypothetical protein
MRSVSGAEVEEVVLMAKIDDARDELAAAKAKGDLADFMKRAGAILDKGMKFKAGMQKRGMRRGRAKCPFCPNGYWHGTLNGRKDHLHFACDGAGCDVSMME